jgi:hypothetical protein
MLPAGQAHHAFILAGRLLVPFGIALNVLSRCGTAKDEWFGHSPPIKCVDSICRDASLPPGMTEVGTELDRRFARIAVPGVIIVAGSRRSQVHVSKAVRPLSADRDAMAAWGQRSNCYAFTFKPGNRHAGYLDLNCCRRSVRRLAVLAPDQRMAR